MLPAQVPGNPPALSTGPRACRHQSRHGWCPLGMGLYMHGVPGLPGARGKVCRRGGPAGQLCCSSAAALGRAEGKNLTRAGELEISHLISEAVPFDSWALQPPAVGLAWLSSTSRS